MKALISGLIGIVLVSTLPTYSAEANGKHEAGEKRLFTKHFQETLFDITEHAAFSLEIILDEKEHEIGKDVIGIVVHNEKDSDVAGAKLTIVHKNLETGEPAPGTITITDKGNGLYIISGLDLEREGRWELAITVRKDGTEDRVKFIFPDVLKRRHPKGRYSQ